MKFKKSCGLIIFKNSNNREYLILLYPGGHWDFVKGNVEEGEDELETAFRETKEETDLEKIEFIKGFKETISYFYRNRKDLIKKDVIFFLGEAKESNVKLSPEHKGFAWLPYNKAIKRLTFKNTKKILAKAELFIIEEFLL